MNLSGSVSVHFGPGVTWALARHLLLDASLIGIVFEDFGLGDSPVGGSTLGLMPTLMLAIQI